MRQRLCWTVILLVAAPAAWAETPERVLPLASAIEQAWERSPEIKAKQREVEAVQARENLQAGLLWPRLSLEGSYRHLTEIPALRLPLAGAQALELDFGAHDNYSIGPMVSWTVWDSGGLYQAWLGAQASRQAKESELQGLRLQIRRQTRVAYFQTQLAFEKVSLMLDALALVSAQYQDIQTQVRAGTSNRLDTLSSHQEVLNQQRQLLQARGEAGAAARELRRRLGESGGPEWSWPLTPEQAAKLPVRSEPASVLLILDPLQASWNVMQPFAQAGLDPHHPQREVLVRLAESSRRAAAGAAAGFWPKLSLAAKTSLDYPNGPILETINQNMISAGLSWTWFQGGAIRQQVEQLQQTTRVYEENEKQVALDHVLEWDHARAALAQFDRISELDRTAVTETEELARLMYQAFRIGRVNYLEVQTANYHALGAKVQAVQTRVAILIQLASLESLALSKEQP